jgi:anti-sigma regulatory factor (Ser/Thr protein kinase)
VPPTNEQDGRRPRPDAADVLRAGASAELDLTLAADWVSPSIVRARVRTWLWAHRWPAAAAQDLVLAVSEAVSNSIEHGYRIPVDHVQGHPQTIRVRAGFTVDAAGFGRVRFEVRDDGVWQRPADVPSSRGRGVMIMRACADEITIEGSDSGTTVTLTSRPVPIL